MWLDEGDPIEELVACGLLIHDELSSDGMETQLSFLHRTFLEYLAARALAGDLAASTDARKWDTVLVHA
jgi:hypothetical protein